MLQASIRAICLGSDRLLYRDAAIPSGAGRVHERLTGDHQVVSIDIHAADDSVRCRSRGGKHQEPGRISVPSKCPNVTGNHTLGLGENWMGITVVHYRHARDSDAVCEKSRNADPQAMLVTKATNA